jgi:hypothetical protein
MKNKFTPFTMAFAAAAAFLAVLISGCVTAPAPVQAVSTGFPLIDIVDAQVDISSESRFGQEEEKQWVRGPATKIIGGTQNSRIVPKDITIKLVETTIQVPIRNGEDVTAWFLNIPNGLKATVRSVDPDAKYAVEAGATEILITISGVPEQTINQPIKINVPYEVTNRLWDFHIPPNNDLRFEVYGVTMAPVIIGGAVNRDIDSKTFTIRFGGTVLADTIAQNTDVSSWFTNLPRGLKAVSAEDTVPATQGQQSLLVTISGKPTNQSRENALIKIPANITVSNMVLEIPGSENTRYDIGSFSSIAADNVELKTGTNWRGEQADWGLTGPEVFKLKDFTAVGIIQISSETVYQIGADGQYHWTGDPITYGKLMAEAKKLNAHAIIDVVIDLSDAISEMVVRRHVEDGHAMTPLEEAMLAATPPTLAWEYDPNGGLIFEEKISVTKRTYTGTALAITYAPAYQPTVGAGATTGYVPAVPSEKDLLDELSKVVISTFKGMTSK